MANIAHKNKEEILNYESKENKLLRLHLDLASAVKAPTIGNYVVGLQSIIIVGLEVKGLEKHLIDGYVDISVAQETLNGKSLRLFYEASHHHNKILYRDGTSLILYKALMVNYLALGLMLGFTLKQIEGVYLGDKV